jgi:hypothetical protein
MVAARRPTATADKQGLSVGFLDDQVAVTGGRWKWGKDLEALEALAGR